jgi:hypothetical protein
MNIAEPLVSESSTSETETAIKRLKRYKLWGIDQIPAELIQAGSNTLCSEIHKHINPIWNKEELLQQWEESISIPIHKKCDRID